MFKGKALITLAEDREKSTASTFETLHDADQNDYEHMVASLVRLGYEVYFVNWMDFNEVHGEFTRLFIHNSRIYQTCPLKEMDLIFVYKQEGFLNNLPRFWNMLTKMEESGAVVVNNPNTIRKNITKDYMFGLRDAGFNVLPTYRISSEIIARISGGEKMVIKPRCAERGKGQGLVSSSQEVEPFLEHKEEYIAQEFCEEIRQGEISLAFAGKRYMHAVIKWPNKDDPEEYRCNESAGGSWKAYTPSQKLIAYSQRLLQYWEDNGCPVAFSRIDLVLVGNEPVLVEAELLNPSCFANYLHVGPEFGAALAEHFDSLVMKSRAIRQNANNNNNKNDIG
eukprot:m.335534 g.335534  ORF g.335534 m.335534 type:complete len:337 (+) comp17623_c0_seq1:147-1157(+)